MPDSYIQAPPCGKEKNADADADDDDASTEISLLTEGPIPLTCDNPATVLALLIDIA